MSVARLWAAMLALALAGCVFEASVARGAEAPAAEPVAAVARFAAGGGPGPDIEPSLVDHVPRRP